MDIVREIVEKIRKRPEMYLGEKNIERLSAFLSGYLIREMEIDPNYHNEFLRGFQEYVSEYYKVTGTQGWPEIIRFWSTSSDGAFLTFFERYDEYCNQISSKNF